MAFLTLRDETLASPPRPTVLHLLNHLIFSQSDSLIAAAPDLPPHEVSIKNSTFPCEFWFDSSDFLTPICWIFLLGHVWRDVPVGVGSKHFSHWRTRGRDSILHSTVPLGECFLGFGLQIHIQFHCSNSWGCKVHLKLENKREHCWSKNNSKEKQYIS